LKYFYERAAEYHLVSAGSLLGIALHEGASFPVGKVNSLTLHPLDFIEFLAAMGKERQAEAVRETDFALLQPLFSEELAALLKEYLFVGGMPAVVSDYSLHRDMREARRLQEGILNDYDRDFSKHAPARIIERMRLVWASLPSQLGKENKKFIYGAVRSGARAKDLEEAIQWLGDYGVICKVPHVSAIRTPLASYASISDFKLFVLDVGLLGAMAGLDASTVLEGSALFTEFKGSYTEQYVEQQLQASGLKPYYWSSANSSNEVDFVIGWRDAAVPLEAKASENLKSKSLKAVRERYDLPRCVRTSLAGYRDEGWLVNIPLWAIGSLQKLLEDRSAIATNLRQTQKSLTSTWVW
jgi:predicted AAA+ superfamily ATPase